MDQISVEHNASPAKLEVMGVYEWPIWSKEISEFPWTYDKKETCYILDGEVTVIPKGGEPVEIGAGDLVIFPKGLQCEWRIHKAVNKHYNFS